MNIPDMDLTQATVRIVAIAILIVLLTPVATAAVTYSPAQGVADSDTTVTDDITFISTQGAVTDQGAGVYALNTDTKKIVWSYRECPNKCFDIDPLGNNTVLFVAKTSDHKPWEIGGNVSYNWHAIHMNWRTGEIIAKFPVPIETHDVDYLGDGQYIVANKVRADDAEQKWVEEAKSNGWINQSRSTHSHLVYIYDRKADDIVWEYRFVDHFPRSAGDGYNADYTHLNDVDVVDNGSSMVVSPREFDRVMLINRSTKEVEWTLGEEDNYEILHEQHNPNLLTTDPPTVLVADSENDRIVEYRREDGEWVLTWEYSGQLRWPRDADRLPNGNTLIIDSGGDRAIEVTPQKEIVWSVEIPSSPYDIERLRYGDEPSGPPMHEILPPEKLGPEYEGDRGLLDRGFALWYRYYDLSGWVLPPWIDQGRFVLLHGAVAVLLGWMRFEWKHARGRII